MALKMYSTGWCADCRRAKRFLKANSIVFGEINIDKSDEAAELVMKQTMASAAFPRLTSTVRITAIRL